MTSVFKAMKENPALKRGLKTAKKGDPDAKYNGPDGDVLVVLKRQSMVQTKSKDDMAIVEFAVAEGEENEGQKLSCTYVFADNTAFTAVETMGRFFGDMQLLGIETDDRTEEAIEKDVDKLIAKKDIIKVAVSDGTSKYPDVTIIGIVEGDDVPLVEADDENADEWEEEESDGVPDPDEDDSLVGGLCKYDVDDCVVLSHDEEAETLVLGDPEDGETVWYEDVPVADVEWVEEDE